MSGNQGDTSEDEKDFKARDYQVQLLSIAQRENTIIFLPTGSGKTFVAVMLIKSMSRALEKPYKIGGKRTFFAVNTVALVTQQGDYIARHTPFSVGKYSGDLNVDNWDAKKWDEELNKNQVLVLTCQILLDMLLHGFVLLENINLIIFDECHHAVSDHCMRRVMQLFEKCPKDSHPRVLGLSATLMNGNRKPNKVLGEVKNLETTFQGKVATVDDLRQVNGFSTNPLEKIVMFQQGYSSLAAKEVRGLHANVIGELDSALDILANINPDCLSLTGSRVSFQSVKNLKYMNESSGSRERKRLKSIVNDVRVMLDDYGVFGCYYAALYAIIALHRRRLAVDSASAIRVICGLLTRMTLIRKMISDVMDEYLPNEQITKFSTDKILTVLDEILKNESSLQEDMESLSLNQALVKRTTPSLINPCALIFVERRQSAKTLYQILKFASENCKNFKSVKPEFVVGMSANPGSMESSVNNKKHHEAIQKFRSGVCNYLVASDVMEEGVDIPLCSLVVKLDFPKTFRSYVQSKGRARHATSKFIMFVPAWDEMKIMSSLREFHDVEKILKQILIGKTDDRKAPSEREVRNRLYFHDLPHYPSDDKSAFIDLVSATALIHRYCAQLPQDKFSMLSPVWVLDEGASSSSTSPLNSNIKNTQNRSRLAYLQLPINAPVRSIIKGIPMASKRLAKRAAALVGCAILHRMGELGKNDLLPVTRNIEDVAYQSLCPCWKEEKDITGVPGSKKLKRVYKKEVPEILSRCHPKPNVPTYVYHIYETPVYDAPSPNDSRGTGIFNVLNMKRGYAILTSKRLPPVCDFSLYMSHGEMSVSFGVETEREVLNLSEKQIEELEEFHTMLFLDLLNICKQFFMVDKTNTVNAYLIAPTCLDSAGKWVIDWDVVRNFPELPLVNDMPPEEKKNLQVDDSNFLYEVVTPWYRGSCTERHYIVTKVCQDMCAKSPFPSMSFDSFEEYFVEKYRLKLTHPDKHLLEVKAISSQIDCTHPKGVSKPFDETMQTKQMSKRQMQKIQGEFLEHLVPELVTRRKFPATLWLKATTLPTVLHRFTCMHIADELRSLACREANIKLVEPAGGTWRRLNVELNEVPPEEMIPRNAVQINSSFFSHVPTCSNDEEAPDIDHEIESICLMDVMQYHKIEMRENDSQVVQRSECVNIEPATMPSRVYNLIQGFGINDQKECRGPELADVLSALTGASSADVFNLERLETLGDSFLKFSMTTFLYLKFPEMDEGKLSLIKGKMISNRNLFYCAQGKNLGGKLKVNPFAPRSDWIPPGFAVPPFLREKLNSQGGITKNILFQLTIPEYDRRSGQLSPDTMNDIVESLNESRTNNTLGAMSSALEALLGTQSVPDKSVADCVEAMIGAWLKAGGFEGALRLLGWLNVLPQGSNGGPAGSWEELVGREALCLGQSGILKNKEDYSIIGGVVDWGPIESHYYPPCDAKNEPSSLDFIGCSQKQSCNQEVSDIKPCSLLETSENCIESPLNEESNSGNPQKPSVENEGGNCHVKIDCGNSDKTDSYCSDRSVDYDSYTHLDEVDIANLDEVDCNDTNSDEDDAMISYKSMDENDWLDERSSHSPSSCHFEEEIDEFHDEDLLHDDMSYKSMDENDWLDERNSHSPSSSHFEEEIDELHDEFLLHDDMSYKSMDENDWLDERSNHHPSSCQFEEEIDEFHDEDLLHDDDSCTNQSSYRNECDILLSDRSNSLSSFKITAQVPTVNDSKIRPSQSNGSQPKRRKLSDEYFLPSSNEVIVSERLDKNIEGKAMESSDDLVKVIFEKSRETIRGKRRNPLVMCGNSEIDSGMDIGKAKDTLDDLLSGASRLEKDINYRFKNRYLLLQALTHPSYYPNRITECYQRLEFLGDAVLDFVITCHIYEIGGNLNPGQLTDLRSALVNNITFASLAVRYGLHHYILHLSPSLMDAIDKFVDFQVERNHVVTEDCLVLMEEGDCFLAESVEVPKALGDIMESLAGAIFLDSGLSLTAVWEVFYPMMSKEIEAFTKKVPKQPVRELLETDAEVHFLPAETVPAATYDEDNRSAVLNRNIVMVPVKIVDKATRQDRTFFGFGERKSLAKRAAAKLALREMGKCP